MKPLKVIAIGIAGFWIGGSIIAWGMSGKLDQFALLWPLYRFKILRQKPAEDLSSLIPDTTTASSRSGREETAERPATRT